MSTATARKTDAEPAGEKPRKLPEIDPAMCWINLHGGAFKEMLVRLPADFAITDLVEPGIWKRIQSDRTKALQKLDRVVMVDHDEGKMFTCIVAAATSTGASLSKPQVTDLISRLPSQFADDQYAIEWRGNGYAVVRKADKHVMASGFQSQGAAITALNQLYPRVA